MKKFVFIYSTAKEGHTDESTQEWISWFKSIGSNLVNAGTSLGSGKLVSHKGVKEITHEMQPLSGFSIIQAENLDEAVEIAQGCPGKLSIRVYETTQN